MVGRIVRGLTAGAVGTAFMTALQEGMSRARGSGGGGCESWDKAPGPAQVANAVYRTVAGDDLPVSAIPLATNVMHWLYGATMGVPFALAKPRRAGPLAAGIGHGLLVWAWSYAQLVPLGIYEPPWHYSAKQLAPDIAYHVVYGTDAAGAYGVLDSI
jgi:hypothetical protein